MKAVPGIEKQLNMSGRGTLVNTTNNPEQNHILTSKAKGVLNITLNRPEKRNAITYPMYRFLTELFSHANRDDDIRVVVVTGSGNYFTSGNDVNAFKSGANLAYHEKPAFHFMNALATFKKPVIAAVNGDAVGIGVTMLLHCDFIYATEGSSFRMPFIDLGLVPEFGSTLILTTTLGHPKAAQLLMTGDAFSCEQALALGIVSEVLTNDQLDIRVRSLALKLASKPSHSLQTTKRLMKQGQSSEIANAIEREAIAFADCLNRLDTQAIIATIFKGKTPSETQTKNQS